MNETTVPNTRYKKWRAAAVSGGFVLAETFVKSDKLLTRKTATFHTAKR